MTFCKRVKVLQTKRSDFLKMRGGEVLYSKRGAILITKTAEILCTKRREHSNKKGSYFHAKNGKKKSFLYDRKMKFSL